ncbi:class I SAM-dependent methyltransferase [Cellvibrio polysaccharolyticus]|uniref:Ribosomal RNA small subunit methyltransferase J n=1 Tax=Cellvibrio polysaccharolyticus TaxID=2082724 RepID=A0A928V135_9GAMM|nr:class I SAM-dependent methyltransferase [Cellvibrio polysaccharolyticus]MBE8716783.1 SAM-dependent methyltransferase [Cellvibrio polysaccharolyticus]
MFLPVICNSAADESLAAAIAERLQQPLHSQVSLAEWAESAFVLLVDEAGVALQQTGRKAPGPVRVEFTEGAVDHRRKFGGGKGQMIAKAVGLKAGVFPHVLDATAGLGRDAFVLASLGCPVTLLERSPVVQQLLLNGFARARQFAHINDPQLLDILSRMRLIEQDSGIYLQQPVSAQQPDVVYLDPMFPQREKTADVKKEMKVFHDIVGADEDSDALLGPALQQARCRVVVKRPRKAPFLAGRTPSYQLEGKSSRYDIYSLQKLPERLPAIVFES